MTPRLLRTRRNLFQSTPSGGKATQRLNQTPRVLDVSIHAFRGEGDRRGGADGGDAARVSIHAFRGEGDTTTTDTAVISIAFQSTPSGGKATIAGRNTLQKVAVSIHAFRGEGDRAAMCSCST